MRNEVVTIFGGTGFIGRHLVRRVAQTGATIRVVTRDPDRAGFLRPMGAVGQIALLPYAADEAGVKRLVDGSTGVVNLLGILFERRSGDFMAVHRDVPERIAQAAAATGVRRLVQMSAIGADAASQANYARTKAEGEAAVRAAFPEATILRPSVVFGAEDDFFNRFGKMAQFSPFLPLIDGGQTRFQPVYVDDVAQAVVTVLTTPGHAGQTYELGGPDVYTFRELLAYLLKVLNRKRMLLSLPSSVARIQARFLEWLPSPPLTRDQIELLKHDNVVAPGALTLADLGIKPTPLEVVVPDYVERYARHATRRV